MVWKPEGKTPSELDVKCSASLLAVQIKHCLRKRENVMSTVVSPADGEACSLYPSIGGSSFASMDTLLKKFKDVLTEAPPPASLHDGGVAHRMRLVPGAMPLANRTYNLSPAELDELRNVLNWFHVRCHQPNGRTGCHLLEWMSYVINSMSC